METRVDIRDRLLPFFAWIWPNPFLGAIISLRWWRIRWMKPHPSAWKHGVAIIFFGVLLAIARAAYNLSGGTLVHELVAFPLAAIHFYSFANALLALFGRPPAFWDRYAPILRFFRLPTEPPVFRLNHPVRKVYPLPLPLRMLLGCLRSFAIFFAVVLFGGLGMVIGLWFMVSGLTSILLTKFPWNSGLIPERLANRLQAAVDYVIREAKRAMDYPVVIPYIFASDIAYMAIYLIISWPVILEYLLRMAYELTGLMALETIIRLLQATDFYVAHSMSSMIICFFLFLEPILNRFFLWREDVPPLKTFMGWHEFFFDMDPIKTIAKAMLGYLRDDGG